MKLYQDMYKAPFR